MEGKPQPTLSVAVGILSVNDTIEEKEDSRATDGLPSMHSFGDWRHFHLFRFLRHFRRVQNPIHVMLADVHLQDDLWLITGDITWYCPKCHHRFSGPPHKLREFTQNGCPDCRERRVWRRLRLAGIVVFVFAFGAALVLIARHSGTISIADLLLAFLIWLVANLAWEATAGALADREELRNGLSRAIPFPTKRPSDQTPKDAPASKRRKTSRDFEHGRKSLNERKNRKKDSRPSESAASIFKEACNSTKS